MSKKTTKLIRVTKPTNQVVSYTIPPQAIHNEDCNNCVNFCNVDVCCYIGEENRNILTEECRNCVQKVANYIGEAEQLIDYILNGSFESVSEIKDYIFDVFDEYLTETNTEPIARGNGSKDLFGYSVPEASEPPTA